MSKKIPMSLSVASINEMINKLNNIENVVQPAIKEGVQETMEYALEMVVDLTPYDTGETATSTMYEITDTKAILKQSGDHVFENEFGDGEYFGSYPDSSKVPESMPTHDKAYYFVPDNPESQYYHVGKDGKVIPLRARGQKPSAQMFTGAIIIRDNINKNIKKKVSDALSKI